nr:hypothetical protein [Tanacetum cinerariifolium]
MARTLFNRIVTEVTNYDPFFHFNTDCARREGISPLIKCTSAIRQLAYGLNGNFLAEYMQISERSSRMALDHFCEAVIEIYGPEFLRKPTVTDIEKLYQHHEEKHVFPGMLGILDCTDWEWFGCPYAFKGQYVRRDHGSNPFTLLEVVASQDLWICHAFFGVVGSNNDINVLYQSLYLTISKPAEHQRFLLWLTASVTDSISTIGTPVSTISSHDNTANLSDATVYAFLANQPNGSQLVHEDIEQIHEDDLEEMDLKWQLVLLSMRARRYFQRIGKKITINGSDTAGYDKTKVQCFNCHKMGHFLRECRSPRNQESRPRNQDSSRKTVNVKDTSSKAMVVIDGVGFDWSYMADDEVSTNMALTAFLDSDVHNSKTCSNTCLRSFETLKTQYDNLRIEFNKSEFELATYKRGLASVEEQLVFYKKNEGDYEMWKLRIEQYFQVQDYALWDVMENGNSFKPVPQTISNADSTSTLTIPGPTTTEEKAQKKNDVKARSMLLMALPNEHLLTFSQYKDAKTLFEAIQVRFNGNDATKKTQRTLLKQMYENFNAPSIESLDSIFNRL